MARNGKKLTNKGIRFPSKKLISNKESSFIKEPKIHFSFKYLNQIDNFGIGDCNQKWFIGLLERLKNLETFTISELMEANKNGKAIRFHKIDWNLKNVPIKKNDLSWIPTNILTNEDEFPIMQLAISISKGRIIGFFDNNYADFNIILLDPMHNLQPSIHDNKQIQKTTKGISEYDNLLSKIQNIKNIISNCNCISPKKCNILEKIETLKDKEVSYINLDKDFYNAYLSELEIYTLEDIFKEGILSLNK